MPCKDTTANLRLRLDAEEKVIDYEFSKLSCSKPIGAGEVFKNYCLERAIDEIYDLRLEDLFKQAASDNEEDRFLLYLEWEAVRACIALYQGRTEWDEHERYKIASILHENECISISLAAEPLSEMPRVLPCSIRNSSDQSG